MTLGITRRPERLEVGEAVVSAVGCMPLFCRQRLIIRIVEALAVPSELRREFLKQPQVAVGIAEPGVLHTHEILNLADFDPAPHERPPGFVYVRYDEV